MPANVLGPPAAWVVGSGGLLGGAVCRYLRARGHVVLTSSIPWQDPAAAVAELLHEAARLPSSPWEVYWCAGSGVVGSGPKQLDQEVEVLQSFLQQWRPVPGANGFFLASSAGGVYAGSHGPPFTEYTMPVPISRYGRAKLRSEEVATAFAERSGVSLLVGRISNLYGPGQDIGKQQGLISQLCRAELSRQPLSIYVSLDTMRDYLFVDDAAAMVVTATGQVTGSGRRALKVLGSERSTTVGAILGELRRVTRRRPPVVLGTSASARLQVRDLRLRSVAWPSTRGLARTQLGAGVAATLASIGDQARASRAGPVTAPGASGPTSPAGLAEPGARGR
ncbi:MAG: NAD-dependent epimerase/dehydratase family protein [Actinomycetota bacterium]|nr:NAD-dependent epimerase/dehydratase family protein [Actinomycetota bacterium]